VPSGSTNPSKIQRKLKFFLTGWKTPTIASKWSKVDDCGGVSRMSVFRGNITIPLTTKEESSSRQAPRGLRREVRQPDGHHKLDGYLMVFPSTSGRSSRRRSPSIMLKKEVRAFQRFFMSGRWTAPSTAGPDPDPPRSAITPSWKKTLSWRHGPVIEIWGKERFDEEIRKSGERSRASAITWPTWNLTASSLAGFPCCFHR